MTAEAEAVSPAELSSLPSCTLTAGQLGDLELLLSGAYAPLSGFMTDADASAVSAGWQLADGTPFPVAVTLDVAEAAMPAAPGGSPGSRVLLADPEGTPIAVMTINERTALPGRTVRLAGPVAANRPPEHGPFRDLMLSPEATRGQLGDGPVLAFGTRAPLGSRQIGQLRHLAGHLRAQILVLPLISGRAEVVGTPQALIRSVLAAMPSLPPNSLVVPVPFAPRPGPSEPGARASRAGADRGPLRCNASDGRRRAAWSGAGQRRSERERPDPSTAVG